VGCKRSALAAQGKLERADRQPDKAEEEQALELPLAYKQRTGRLGRQLKIESLPHKFN